MLRRNRSDGYASIVASKQSCLIGLFVDSPRVITSIPPRLESIKDLGNGLRLQGRYENFSAPILAFPDGTDNFVIYNASHNGFVTIIMQKEKVIAYDSRQLKVHEKNYTTHELQHILDKRELNMRPRRLLRLLSDFDCKIRYHPGKASVAADALSRNERAKPLRVRSLVMTINSNLSPQIHEARVEALEKENVKDENLHDMDKEFENRLDGTLYIRRRSWLPCIRDLGELIKHESHKPNYFIHPGIG
ncbi:putative reverse transcriptase domain-containing protein [Tanacetum coccineum]